MTYIGQPLSQQEKVAILEGNWASKGNSESKRLEVTRNLSLHISKQVCIQLGGDLQISTLSDQVDKTNILFYVKCRDPYKP